MARHQHASATPGVAHWHAGYNQPGYLPEAEPGIYASFEAAREALAADMDTHADATETWPDTHDCDDVECPTYGDDCPAQTADCIRAERDDLLAADGPEWSGICGGLAYWVSGCDEIDCVNELVAHVAAEFANDGSALAVLAATGAVIAGAADEADEQRQVASAGDQSDLEVLCAYVAAVGERGPVPEWPAG